MALDGIAVFLLIVGGGVLLFDLVIPFLKQAYNLLMLYIFGDRSGY